MDMETRVHYNVFCSSARPVIKFSAAAGICASCGDRINSPGNAMILGIVY